MPNRGHLLRCKVNDHSVSVFIKPEVQWSHWIFRWVLFSPFQASVSHMGWAVLKKYTHTHKRKITSSCNSFDSLVESDLGTDESKNHHVSEHLMTWAQDLFVHISGLIFSREGGFAHGHVMERAERAPDLQALENLPCLIRGCAKKHRSYKCLLTAISSTGGPARLCFHYCLWLWCSQLFGG